MSEEALEIAMKTRKVKGKGEKERYKHLNADFQRIARRDKKAFLSDQCREAEENNRERLEISSRKFEIPREYIMQNTIRDRNGMGLTEAEDVKKRWQEGIEELLKRVEGIEDLNDPYNHDGVITHLDSSPKI